MFPPGELGLLLLDTRFPRLPGDLGRPDSWPVPVICERVAHAWPARVVRSPDAVLGDAALLEAFVAAARRLEAAGVRAITTSCGFLVLVQARLQAAVTVPVVTSSLMQLPQLLAREARVGVLTMDAGVLGPAHQLSAGVPPDRLADVLVEGMDPDGAFAGAILGNRLQLDQALAEREVVAAARCLRSRAPDLRTLVLECTNMPPYARAVHAATGLVVRSLLDSEELLAAHGVAGGWARQP